MLEFDIKRRYLDVKMVDFTSIINCLNVFLMYIQADREKEATKKREEEERIEQERLEAAIRHSEELEKERKELEKARIRSSLKSKLPKEPKEEKEEGQPVSKLRFRVPIPAHDENSDEESKDKNSGRPNVKGGN